MATTPRQPDSPTNSDRQPGLLAGMRIRKKLIVLHTLFSLLLAAILVVALRPSVRAVVQEAEEHEARLVMNLLSSRMKLAAKSDPITTEQTLAELQSGLPSDVELRAGSVTLLGLDTQAASHAHAKPGEPVAVLRSDGPPTVVVYDAAHDTYYSARVSMQSARNAVVWVYALLVGALLGVYALIALALEVFVLPRHVYSPIRAMLRADDAVRLNERSAELIPAQEIPADELGQIMRSRNQTVRAMRDNERRLNEALAEIERVAADLQKKNTLIEAAQRNLADADRLASLGILSAGLAHEMNTPLAVVKGLAEKLVKDPYRALETDEAALLLRVVGRLERLSESLLDFARVRPPTSKPANLKALIDEAWTLVRLDREARSVTYINDVQDELIILCDADRIVQVLVNLLRNAVDACGSTSKPTVEVAATLQSRQTEEWVSILIRDNGPGIAPEIIGRLFEPFATTRLDSKGTGLGLAVSQGIIREHGGVLIARNRELPRDAHSTTNQPAGAEFEILLPVGTPTPAQRSSQP